MTGDIEILKRMVRSFLREQLEPVPSQRAMSGKVHLEVWRTRAKGRPLGLEMDHKDRVNFWIVRMSVPAGLPASVEVTHKVPKGRAWTDENGRGANSNLSAYDEFRTKPITRLGVISEKDARFILEHLVS